MNLLFPRFLINMGSVEWIVAGLGNPGRQYELSRHNIGFLTLDFLADRYNTQMKNMKFQSLCGKYQNALFLKPQTFMNLSGVSVGEAVRFYKLPPERVIIVYDDVALPLGKLRIRAAGSDGGHNGIKSILYHLQTDTFVRVKIGVGAKPHPEMELADWVLSSFSSLEQRIMSDAVSAAADACEHIMRKSVESAMNVFNRNNANK